MAASSNVTNLQQRISGVLPVRVDVPRAGNSYNFVRPLVLDEETKVSFTYNSKKVWIPSSTSGFAVRRTHGAIQGLLRLLFQPTSSALRKFAQRQRPDGHTHEPAHFYFQRFEHSPDVPVLAFFQHNFEPRITFAIAKNA